MKLQQNIAVTSMTHQLRFEDLQRMVAAVQKQLTRDYYPVWQRPTNVVAVRWGDPWPHGYWHAYIKDSIGAPGASGYHTDKNRQPQIFVQWNGFENTAITLSHECLEAATDPFGNRLITANLPGIGACSVLAEIADPPEAESYLIDGVPVSDFITPEWYDSEKLPGVRYSFLDRIERPCSLIYGGYVSYIKPGGEWEQQTWFDGSSPAVRSLGSAEMGRFASESLREWIDRVTTPLQVAAD